MTWDDAFDVCAEADGWRLDKVLEMVLPGAGLRLRRRLCTEGRVLVEGKVQRPGYKVRTGQHVEILQGREGMQPRELGLKVVKQEAGFAAINKPGNIHSAAIAGKEEPSVEGVLSVLFPKNSPVLLNRLDYLTSGLLLVALTPEAREAYLLREEDGAIKKFYLARVHGRLDGIVSIRSKLDSDDRKKTRVLATRDSDIRRWTDVTALSHDNTANTSLVRCLIMKGARHQIRAHLASIGHSIVGDPLYGEGESSKGLMLHHQRIELPGFWAESTPLF
ncbi:RluA family pseudouridine synthase [Pseudodesulfovibrio sp. S3]|nr:RluA family pseudouridine synthase [Pseudodesulfovibrio sp. S3]